MSALVEHRTLVAETFTALRPIARFEPLGDGWTSFTYLVDGDWVVQIPRGRYGEETMVKQLDLLPGLASEVSAPIPRPVHVSRDPLMMAYPLIVGEPFSGVSPDGVWPERLGRFLYDVHLCPPEFVGLRWRSATVVREERRSQLDGFRERVFPLLSDEEQRGFGARFDRFVDDDDNWRFAPCLVHADLGPDHVLVHPNGDLAGVIDWEEAMIGDPAGDFAYLVHAFPAQGERALAAYGGPPDATFRERMRFSYRL
ncbi:MAG TPA: aminoglycoside phosphotransferase family protein, partial [Actinomycetota bacterium]